MTCCIGLRGSRGVVRLDKSRLEEAKPPPISRSFLWTYTTVWYQHHYLIDFNILQLYMFQSISGHCTHLSLATACVNLSSKNLFHSKVGLQKFPLMFAISVAIPMKNHGYWPLYLRCIISAVALS